MITKCDLIIITWVIARVILKLYRSAYKCERCVEVWDTLDSWNPYCAGTRTFYDDTIEGNKSIIKNTVLRIWKCLCAILYCQPIDLNSHGLPLTTCKACPSLEQRPPCESFWLLFSVVKQPTVTSHLISPSCSGQNTLNCMTVCYCIYIVIVIAVILTRSYRLG